VKKQDYGFSVMVWVLGLTLLGMASQSFGDTEIDLDDTAQPAPTPVASNPIPAPAPKANPVPTTTAYSLTTVSPIPTTVIKVLWPSPTPTEEAVDDATPIEVHGVLKMKDIYAAGIKAYQEQDYDKAIRYLKKSLETEDPYSAKFYYAEANAMLGVIYQFHIIHYDWAYQYYQSALKYEKGNTTARRHIKEVAKYKNQED
jgi:tetratricopeptide (TPR) repeat protein